MKKGTIRIAALLIASISILVIILTYLYFTYEEEETGNTLFEVFNKHGRLIDQYNADHGTLIRSIGLSEHVSEGRYSEVWILLKEFDSNDNISTEIMISIIDNEIVSIAFENHTSNISSDPDPYYKGFEVGDIRIDSDEAYSTAVENKHLKEYLEDGRKHDVDFRSTNIDCFISPIKYHFIWFYEIGGYDPQWADVQIDAVTGEILPESYAAEKGLLE